MSLQDEIDKSRSVIRTESFSMSIGEWMNLYSDKELDIHPEFQRFYRWTPHQKTRLIESILLGIPIPQIFIAQRKDGVWDVVDGVQRLSTIFQFAGILLDEQDNLVEPFMLEGTKDLPSLEGKKWEDDDSADALSSTQRLIIKRSKIDVSVILKESDEKTKFELFQRLNTGGTPLSDQEVRNSILVQIDNEIYRWLRNLSENEDFRECISLTDRALDEKYDMDLALRFVLFRVITEDELKNIGDINEFITDRMIELVSEKAIDLETEQKAFEYTFSFLRNSFGSESFHKYDPKRNAFVGGFLISAFELVALGVGFNYAEIMTKPIDVKKITKHLWKNESFTSKSGSGIRASSRLPNTIPLGRKSFKP